MYQQKKIISENVIYLLEQKKKNVAMIICILLGKFIVLEEGITIKTKKNINFDVQKRTRKEK